MDYIVVSTSKCEYQEWQIRALYWSLKKVNQKGRLILLLSEDKNHSKEQTNFYLDSSVEVFELPDWAKEWELKEGDWWGGIPNKYESIKWLTENRNFEPDDRLLFLDPDMIFLESVDLYPDDNQIIGQLWPQAYDDKKGFMYPFAIKFKTLTTIVDDYKSECIRFRKETDNWISEMWGLVSAAEKHNIEVVYEENLGRCTLWNEDNSKKLASIIHYPNPIESEEEKILGCDLPASVILEVTYTEPGIKGDTATNTLKPSTVETGATVNVPLFINIGDKIKIDTRKGAYSERVKS